VAAIKKRAKSIALLGFLWFAIEGVNGRGMADQPALRKPPVFVRFRPHPPRTGRWRGPADENARHG
jgi:hypothetical protein